MQPVDIITKKKHGLPLTREEIGAFVGGVLNGDFADYQISALLMAICLNGMTESEATDLTLAMAHSGEMLDLSAIDGITVDKHSTGGVGDTTTLILAPLVAACGLKVAKMSGRGLGHTGGTLDKLESIPGMTVDLSTKAFIDQVNAIGCAVMGQTAQLAPADKTLYALRDVTGTVDSLPLIASSIMSKKLASGSECVVLDVKSGSGALMPTLDQSIHLARLMVQIGLRAGRKYSAVVTDMDQPLGRYVGNALEVYEAILALSGQERGALWDVSLLLGAHMLLNAQHVHSVDEGVALLTQKADAGEGLEKLQQMIRAQKGDPRIVDQPSLLPHSQTQWTIRANRNGFITGMDTIALGNAARSLGAGRYYKDDLIDYAAGIVMDVRTGDEVRKGDRLCTLHFSEGRNYESAAKIIGDSIRIGETAPAASPLVYAVIDGKEGEA